MSLILDALRKSEHQRQRQVGPGLAVVPESQARPRPPPWVLVLAVLLVLNVIVVIALFLTDRRPQSASQAPAATAPAAAQPVAPAPAVSPRTAPVALPPRPRREDVRPLTSEVATAAAPAAAPPTTGAVAPPTSPAATPPAPVVQQTEDARLPRFADLVIRGELNVPHMHLDIHVYSGNPAERFVFINMRKYLEGQATQEGPRVERITRDGVVMDYQGQRFTLSRD